MSKDFVTNLIEDIAASPHQLSRVPETSSVMDETTSVDNFNEVMRTNVTINYAAALDYIHRSRGAAHKKSLSALDLCSGPGHYTLCLEKYLGYQRLVGIDLSTGMVAHARKNAQARGRQNDFNFVQGNALDLNPSQFEKFDLVACANAAHHFDSLENVRHVLEFSESVCSTDGLVVLTDLCRLPNQNVSERFISMIGDDYVNNGLLALAEDFRASMYAAWSPDEMALAVPQHSERQWYQVVAGGLPFFQAMIGLPMGRKDLFVREPLNWSQSGIHQTERSLQDWELTKENYYQGMIRPLNVPQVLNGRLRVA